MYPLVTIAIPCFNAEAFIERAIKSAQSQDWPTIEILVVDDASEDNSVRVVEALAKKDNRIRLMCHEANRGTAVARNTLVENARGEFIAFFDADDVSYPERIRLQYQRLTDYERASGADLILCYGAIRVIPADETKSYELKGVGYEPPEPVGWEYIGHYFPVKDDLKKCAWGDSGSNALFMRRAVFEFVGPFDPVLRRGQDSDYTIKAGLKGAHFISVAQPLLDWYINEAGYKTDKILLHYHHLMYRKYKYLFSNGFQHWCVWQFAKLSLCRYMAMRRQKSFLMKWYFGGTLFWLIMISPRTRLKKAWVKTLNVFRRGNANKAEMAHHKAGK